MLVLDRRIGETLRIGHDVTVTAINLDEEPRLKIDAPTHYHVYVTHTKVHTGDIHVGPDITVTVLRKHNNKLRIGVKAPDSVKILRGEKYALIYHNLGDVSVSKKEDDQTDEET